MKIKQWVFTITMLIAFNFVAHAADELTSFDRPGHQLGIITGLELAQSKISINDTVYNINSLVTVHALNGDASANLSQLKTDMGIEYKFADDSDRIIEIWINK